MFVHTHIDKEHLYFTQPYKMYEKLLDYIAFSSHRPIMSTLDFECNIVPVISEGDI